MPTKAEQITQLKQKRTTFKCKLTRFKTFMDKLSNTSNFTELKLKVDNLKESFKEFESVQTELELLDTDNDHSAELVEIENDYFSCSAKAHDILVGPVKQVNNACITSVVTNTNNTDDSNVKDEDNDIYLPKISLPTFSGNYEDWPGFSNQFQSSVHENSKLNNCKKLTYLRSCLKGDAAKVIESLSNTDKNYEIAWSILEKRFNQPAIIVAKHITAMFQVPAVSKSNYADLREFLNKVEAHYRALESLEQPSADTVLIHLLTTKIDKDTICKWKEYNKTDFPDVNDFLKFLHERCRILEPLESNTYDLKNKKRDNYQNSQINNNKQSRGNTHQTFTTQINYNKIICSICKDSHYTQNCEKLTKINLNERFQLVRKLGLCSNCLRKNHLANDCKSSTCKKCNKKHHTLLHADSEQVPSAPSTSISNVASLQAIQSQFRHSQTLLSTAEADILDIYGKSHKCRILIDNGSQANFITEAMASKLKLEKTNITVSVSGIQQLTMPVNCSVKTSIKSRCNDFMLPTSFLVLHKLSEKLPTHFVDQNHINIPKNVKLADPQYYKPSEIDIILGSSVFHKILCVGKISLLNDCVALLKTQFGWILSGELGYENYRSNISVNLTLLNLQNDISKFWEIEETISAKHLSDQETRAENHYKDNTKRDESSGRFIVKLPFKENKNMLGDSYSIAVKRFFSLERSLSKNLIIKEQYINFMREYKELNHMTKIQNPDKNSGYQNFEQYHSITGGF